MPPPPVETHDAIGVKDDTKIMKNMEGLSLTRDHNQDRRPRNRGYWLQSPGNRQLTYDDEHNGGNANIMIDDDDHWDLVTEDRSSPGQPAGVDAHFYASLVYGYFKEIHGRNSFNNADASMLSIVHIPDIDRNNAFWNGQAVFYGDGDGIDIRELSGALDVVGHEWTHAVIQYTSNLIYKDESGALSESFSDQMGTSIEFWADEDVSSECTVVSGGSGGCADWLIGEDVWNWDPTDPTDPPPGLRSMADPAEYGDPDYYDERNTDSGDNGGVHTNSGIPNHAFYLLVKGGSNAGCDTVHHPPNLPHTADCGDDRVVVTGIGLKDAEKIFYGAFTGLQSNATMSNARNATVAMASSLEKIDCGNEKCVATGAEQSTSKAWEAVGLAPPAPPAPDTTPPTVTNVNYSLIDGSELVDQDTDVVITFSEPVNGVNNTSFTLTRKSDNSDIDGAVTVAADRQSATFDPTVSLPETADIEVNVGVSVTDDSDNNLDPSFTSSFTTGAAPVVTGPTVFEIVIWVEQKGPNYQAIAEVYADQDTLIEGTFDWNDDFLNLDSGTVVGGEKFVRLQSKKVRASGGKFTITITNATSGVATCSVSVGEDDPIICPSEN